MAPIEKKTVDQKYSIGYKLASILIYVALSIGMEELNQKLYRKGFKYIFTSIALQQFCIMCLYPVAALLGKKTWNIPAIDGVLSQFILELPTLKAFALLGISAFVWCANVGLGRLVSFMVGSGPLDVMRALIVPFSAVNVYLYYNKKQTKLCMCGIACSTIAFVIYLPNLTEADPETGIKVFKWSLLALSVAVGIVASHQTLVSQHFLKFVDGNAMKMLIYHTPWAIFYFGLMAFYMGEFNGYSYLAGDYVPVIANSNGVECFGVFDKMKNDPDCWPYLIAVAVMGFLINIATMNMLQAVSVVTNNVTAQGKSALGSAIGYTNNFLDAGVVPTQSQILATVVKAIGGCIYTTGKLKASGKILTKKTLPTTTADLVDRSRRASASSLPRVTSDSFNRSMSCVSLGANEDLHISCDSSDIHEPAEPTMAVQDKN